MIQLPSPIQYGLPSVIDQITVSESEPVDLLGGLWAYYNFNSDYHDFSGNNRHLTFFDPPNNVEFVGGRLLNGINITSGGSSKHLRTGNGVSFTGTTHGVSWSISCWVNLSIKDSLIEIVSANYANELVVVSNTGTAPTIWINDYNIELTGSPVSAGWHHVVILGDTINYKLYVDNILVATTPVEVYAPTFSEFRLDGLEDEVAFYNKALSTQEIAALYNNGNGFDPTA